MSVYNKDTEKAMEKMKALLAEAKKMKSKDKPPVGNKTEEVD